MLTYEEANRLFRYCHETGKVYWRVDTKYNKTAGKEAGTKLVRGPLTHRHIKVNRKRYFTHVVAWLLVHGVHPVSMLDHANGNGEDNRMLNLSEKTTQGNARNSSVRSDSSTGVVGVSWYKRKQKYSAYIKVDGVKLHLGYYESIADAIAARKQAEVTHGFSELHGRKR